MKHAHACTVIKPKLFTDRIRKETKLQTDLEIKQKSKDENSNLGLVYHFSHHLSTSVPNLHLQRMMLSVVASLLPLHLHD